MTLRARGKYDLIPGKNNRKSKFHKNIVAIRKTRGRIINNNNLQRQITNNNNTINVGNTTRIIISY